MKEKISIFNVEIISVNEKTRDMKNFKTLPLLFLVLTILTGALSSFTSSVEDDGVPIGDHYKGGKDALLQDIAENLVYPPMAMRNRIQGKCIVHVTMEADGSFSAVKIVKEIGGGCGKAAVAVIESLEGNSKWIAPGYKNNYQIPVIFDINKYKAIQANKK